MFFDGLWFFCERLGSLKFLHEKNTKQKFQFSSNTKCGFYIFLSKWSYVGREFTSFCHQCQCLLHISCPLFGNCVVNNIPWCLLMLQLRCCSQVFFGYLIADMTVFGCACVASIHLPEAILLQSGLCVWFPPQSSFWNPGLTVIQTLAWCTWSKLKAQGKNRKEKIQINEETYRIFSDISFDSLATTTSCHYLCTTVCCGLAEWIKSDFQSEVGTNHKIQLFEKPVRCLPLQLVKRFMPTLVQRKMFLQKTPRP